MIEFTYGEVTGEMLARTGINGFFNAVTGEVFFCARCQHLTAIKNGCMEGLPEGDVLHFPVEEGGAQWGKRSTTYDDIYAWTAAHDWIHFVDHKTPHGKSELHFTTILDAQDKVANRFAKEWSGTPVICRHPDPQGIEAMRNHRERLKETPSCEAPEGRLRSRFNHPVS